MTRMTGAPFPRSVEAMVRELLSVAARDGLIEYRSWAPDSAEPDTLTAGDLVGPANLLAEWLEQARLAPFVGVDLAAGRDRGAVVEVPDGGAAPYPEMAQELGTSLRQHLAITRLLAAALQLRTAQQREAQNDIVERLADACAAAELLETDCAFMKAIIDRKPDALDLTQAELGEVLEIPRYLRREDD